MPPPPPLPDDAKWSYKELAVMNATKVYAHAGLDKTQLEIYCSDFDAVFGMSLGDFHGMPKWKQIQKRKDMKLF